MAFVGEVLGRAASPGVARLLGALLAENHLAADDVLAALVRGPDPGALAAELREAGVRGVPVFVARSEELALELHVRLRRRRRLREVVLP